MRKRQCKDGSYKSLMSMSEEDILFAMELGDKVYWSSHLVPKIDGDYSLYEDSGEEGTGIIMGIRTVPLRRKFKDGKITDTETKKVFCVVYDMKKLPLMVLPKNIYLTREQYLMSINNAITKENVCNI